MITQIPSHLTVAFEFHSRTRVLDDRAEALLRHPTPAPIPKEAATTAHSLHNEHLNGKTRVRWFLNPTSPQTLTLTHLFADSLTHKHLSHPLLDRAEVLPCLLLLLFPFLFLEKLHYVATRTRSSTKYQSAIIPMRSNKSHTTPKKPSAQEFLPNR